MTKRVPFVIAVAVIGLALGWLPGTLSTPSGSAVVSAAGQERRGMMQMPEMMKMQDKMMADMKASQSKMDQLVTKMNAATGDAKISVMAELMTELVREHRAMSEGFGSIDQQMMGRMK
jgi:hypothetical protein